MERLCKKCNLTKDDSKFELARSSNNLYYRLRTCRVCRKTREKEINPSLKSKDLARIRIWKESNKGTIDGFIYSNLYRWRKRSCVKSDLTHEYLKSLWDIQQGCCYYTNVPLTAFGKGSTRKQLTKSQRGPESPSLDKLIPELGYVRGNVVWASYSVNSMKGDMTKDEFLEVCKFISDSRIQQVLSES